MLDDIPDDELDRLAGMGFGPGLQIELESALEQFIPFADIAGGAERVVVQFAEA
jgi:hypothetical protein